MHPATDLELRDWLRYQAEHGSASCVHWLKLRLIAGLPSYALLRPVLLEFKRRDSESRDVGSSTG